MNFWLPFDITNKIVDRLVDFILSKFFGKESNKIENRKDTSEENNQNPKQLGIINKVEQHTHYHYYIDPTPKEIQTFYVSDSDSSVTGRSYNPNDENLNNKNNVQ